MLHYNFPPYSVGETGRMGSPGRREIGHGKLAWRAIHPMLPAKDEFPYTLRVVSEITESNGSSSMATVCGTSLALMDAGVPLKAPVAGIAMGLIKEGDEFAVLSDILGDEDHLGDMDFKVAGSRKRHHLAADGHQDRPASPRRSCRSLWIRPRAAACTFSARWQALGEAAAELGEFAPRIEVMKIPVDKIREVIGTGGKVIREIVEKTGAKVNIDDDGTVKIAPPTARKSRRPRKWINSIVAEPEVGVIYKAPS
jgi:polyribonucleotide nucleotidyltransferase